MGARVPVPDERMQRVIDMLKSTSPTSLLRASRKSRLTALARPPCPQPPFASCPESCCFGSCPLAFNSAGRHRGRHGRHCLPGPTRREYQPSLSITGVQPEAQPIPNSDTGSGSDCNHTDVHGYLPTPPYSLLSRAFPFPRPGFLPTLPPLHSLLPLSSVRSEQEASPEVVGQVP